MSDGSGVDFGVPRSKPFSEHGRQEYDRIFGKQEKKPVFKTTGVLEDMQARSPYGEFNPQAHEQMR